jgi:hypothetical protein
MDVSQDGLRGGDDDDDDDDDEGIIFKFCLIILCVVPRYSETRGDICVDLIDCFLLALHSFMNCCSSFPSTNTFNYLRQAQIPQIFLPN